MANSKRHLIILLILILIVASADLYIRYKKESNPSYNILNLENDPLDITDFTKVDISTLPNSMLLTKNCKSIIMSTNALQTYSIQQGIDDKIDARPLTHDVIKGILDNYNIEVLMVKVTELDAGLYKANMFLKQDNQLLNLETRPSDAIAIAVRKSAPIYLKRDLLDKYGQDSC